MRFKDREPKNDRNLNRPGSTDVLPSPRCALARQRDDKQSSWILAQRFFGYVMKFILYKQSRKMTLNVKGP